MSEILEQINGKIKAAEKQRENLNTMFQEKKKLLAEKKTQQEKNYLAGDDTSKIVAEIVETQVEIDGLYRALKVLGGNLEDLREEQRKELIGVSLTKAQQTGDEIMSATKEVYLAFVGLVEKTAALKIKAREFRGMLRAQHPTSLKYRSQKTDHLCEAIEKGLLPILEHFLTEVFKGGDLPKPDELKRRLTSKPTVKNEYSGDLISPQNYARR